MTQRSITAGTHQTISLKVGGSVTVRGHADEHLIAETHDRGGLTVERRSAAEIGRARAAIGERMLLDVRLKLPAITGKVSEDVIEVQMGGSGEVLVPFESNLKVYAGKDIEVQGIQGQVDAYAGLHLKLENVDILGNVSAGGSMSLECRTMLGKNVEFKAGRDIRFHVQDLTSAQIRVRDLGGYWEARIGEGQTSILLKCGGDVTLVTDQQVDALPPNYILGKIEKPTQA